MYHLAIIFTIVLANGGEQIITIDYDYQFYSETGCYLAGGHELNKAARLGYLAQMPYNTLVNISCEEI